MKQTFYPLCLALGLLATACSSDSPTLPDNQPENALKTPITFSSGVAGGSVGRDAVTTSGSDHGFTAATDLVMHIRSVNSNDASKKRYTRTTATAEVQVDNISKVNFEANDYRYWDDAYGRAAQLSVFAVAVADKKFDATSLNGNSLQEAGNNGWTTTAPNHTLEWTVSESQTETTIAQEDLVYSNNIQGSNVMKFKLTNDAVQDGPGAFDTGELKFDHALTRITVKLKAGKGFEAKPFNFTNSKNVELVNMPTKGTLDVENGTWISVTEKKDINTHEESPSETGIKHLLKAQIFPDYSLSSSETATNMMQFTIDDNTYFVTQAIAYKALFDNKTNNGLAIEETGTYSLAQGKNYIFTITVNKAAISVTATVADWDNVEAANIDKNNAHLSFDFKTPDGGAPCDHFDLYRLGVTSANIITNDSFKNIDWKGDYTAGNKATLTSSGEEGKWNTGWYYESNKEFYHLRTVDKDMEIKGNTDGTEDYFEITSGPVADAFYSDPPTNTVKNSSYNDYHWGAPMKVSDPTYDVEKGYADHIYHAVGATNMPIRISEFHTMSDIHIVLKTTNGQDAVRLFDGAATPKYTKITLMRYYPNGKVLMGNGLVSRTGDPVAAAGTEITAPSKDNSGEYYQTTNTESKHYTYRVVPQPLDYETDQHIGLEILTPDGNKYFINKLSDIKVQGQEDKITRWYPGKKYTYTFTLKKTGIVMTCTVANWKDIIASDTDVDLTK